MVFLTITQYRPLISYCFMKCEVSQTNDVEKKPGSLRISRFNDITHETVVMPATDFDILK